MGRKYRKKEIKRNKRVMIFLMVNIFFFFSVGYAAYGSTFMINGKGVIVGKQTVFEVLKSDLVTIGDGLYEDSYEEERYIYRGDNVDNYISFNGEYAGWRIISLEPDGTIKIIRDVVLTENKAFDEANVRTTANNTYCISPERGCGVFASVTGSFSTPSGKYSGTITEDSTIQKYLNGEYLNNLSINYKQFVQEHVFNVGAVEVRSVSGNDTIEKNITDEKMYTWTGNIGLINVTDILKASVNPLCISATDQYNQSINNYVGVCDDSYLFNKQNILWWTINAMAYENENPSHNAWNVYDNADYGSLGGDNSRHEIGVRPVVFLKSDITLTGSGTYSNPYKIS